MPALFFYYRRKTKYCFLSRNKLRHSKHLKSIFVLSFFLNMKGSPILITLWFYIFFVLSRTSMTTVSFLDYQWKQKTFRVTNTSPTQKVCGRLLGILRLHAIAHLRRCCFNWWCGFKGDDWERLREIRAGNKFKSSLKLLLFYPSFLL